LSFERNSGERTKARREHKVPLSDAAIALHEKQAAIRVNDYVFPSTNGNDGVAARVSRSRP
jgi:integrase